MADRKRGFDHGSDVAPAKLPKNELVEPPLSEGLLQEPAAGQTAPTSPVVECKMYLRAGSSESSDDTAWVKLDVDFLDIRVHQTCLRKVEESVKRTCISNFSAYFTKFLFELGGAIPAIVHDTLGDDWERALDALAKKGLNEDTDKRNICAPFQPPTFYLFGREAGIVSPSVEGKSTFTVPEEQFSEAKPDISEARCLMFVDDIESAFDLCKRSLQTDSVTIRAILARNRVLVHELVHGLRIHYAIQKNSGDLDWRKDKAGEWCLPLEQMKEKVAIPEKFAKFSIGPKEGSESPADAGRLWEHSISNGGAFFTDADVVVVVRRPNQAKAAAVASIFTRDETEKLYENPKYLIEVSREHVKRVMQEQPEGSVLEKYVSCAGRILKHPFQCEGSVNFQLNKIVEASKARSSG